MELLVATRNAGKVREIRKALRGLGLRILSLHDFRDVPEMEEDGKFRVSFRSKNSKVDVNSIARHFGGGGHREAAGARLTGLPQDVETRVLAAVTTALQTAGI